MPSEMLRPNCQRGTGSQKNGYHLTVLLTAQALWLPIFPGHSMDDWISQLGRDHSGDKGEKCFHWRKSTLII